MGASRENPSLTTIVEGAHKGEVFQNGVNTEVHVHRRATLTQGENQCDIPFEVRGKVEDALKNMDHANLKAIVGSLQVPKGTDNECTVRANPPTQETGASR